MTINKDTKHIYKLYRTPIFKEVIFMNIDDNPFIVPDNLFHGVRQNLFNFVGIMKNGIVSAEGSTNSIFFSRNSEGINGTRGISVVVSPMHYNTFDYEALDMYILNGISFVLDALPIETHTPPYNWVDEAVVYNNIPKDKILGIICNEEFAKTPVAEAVEKVCSRMYHKQFFSQYDALRYSLEKTGIDIKSLDKLRSLYRYTREDEDTEKFTLHDKAYKEFASKYQEMFDKKCKKSPATVIDFIQYHNTKNLPVYTNAQVLVAKAEESYKKSKNTCTEDQLKAMLIREKQGRMRRDGKVEFPQEEQPSTPTNKNHTSSSYNNVFGS